MLRKTYLNLVEPLLGKSGFQRRLEISVHSIAHKVIGGEGSEEVASGFLCDTNS